jgi:thioredoxin-dependent peroxiredoxin
MLNIGDTIPLDIPLTDKNNKEVKLTDFKGQYLVIYFYPKDDTEGCTIEACSLRDYNFEIEKLGAKVIGISKDNQKSHEKFRSKFELNFTLLSDESTVFQQACGVWVEKSMFGNDYMGTQRATFIVDGEGKIVYVWEKVKPEEHGLDVYHQLQELLEVK